MVEKMAVMSIARVSKQGLNGGSAGHGEWEEDEREGEEVEGVLVEDCNCLSEEMVVVEGGGRHS
ncbi:hypothetical protein CTI12_AA572310 [Artemisia annua]|uniref:Uncharacterized protein n=1 Tax=Artemisia annua TaxID=35608 RepID=A0A2U1KRL5_ARTAN|nr:hypothetical protein CTI12_AA572310 [Artemisia annua]